MHFGIFLEERRRGASETATYRETLALALAFFQLAWHSPAGTVA